jgi:hypothetical protein
MNSSVKQPTIHRVGKVKLSIIMALVVILPIGALMVAVLRSKYGTTQVRVQVQQEQLVDALDNAQRLTDFEQILDTATSMGLIDELSQFGIGVEQFRLAYYANVQQATNLATDLDMSVDDDAVSARFLSGSEGFGWYASNDQRGLEILNNRLWAWALLTAMVLVIAVCVAIAAFFGVMATFGLTAAVGYKIATLLAGVAGLCFGIANQIARVFDECNRKSINGSRYGFSRHYVLGITTGYSAW